MVKNLSTMQETQVWPLDREDPLEKELATTPVFLPRKSHGQRSLVGYSPWVTKLDMIELLNTTTTLPSSLQNVALEKITLCSE